MRFVPHHILRGCCRVEIGVEVLGTGSEPWCATGTVVKLIQANKGLNANSLLLIRRDRQRGHVESESGRFGARR